MSKEELRRVWSERVAEFKASGLTGKEWCESRGLKQHQLWYWVKKESESGAEAQQQWVEVALGDATEPGLVVKVGHVSIEVHRGFDPGLLLAVTRALAPLC